MVTQVVLLVTMSSREMLWIHWPCSLPSNTLRSQSASKLPMASSLTHKTRWPVARRSRTVSRIPVETTAVKSVSMGIILKITNAKSVTWQVAPSAPQLINAQNVPQISYPCRLTALVAVILMMVSSLTWRRTGTGHAHVKLDTGSLSLDVRLAKTSYPAVSNAIERLQIRWFHSMKVPMLVATHVNTTLTVASAPITTSDRERMCHRIWSLNA